MIGGTFALLAPSAAAYLLLTRRWNGVEAPVGRGLAAAAAPGLGLGFASCMYFALLHLLSDHHTAVRLDAALWIATDIWLLASLMRQESATFKHAAARESIGTLLTPAGLAAFAAFAALIAVVVYSFAMRYAIRPEGEWDAFAIWNLRARAILRGVPDWEMVLSPAIVWSSPHYPLLVPLTVARFWAYTGGESTLVPSAVGFLFLISSVGVVVAAVGRFSGLVTGLAAGMAVVLARTYVYQGACQCADVPTGFYVVVAAAFVSLGHSAVVRGPFLVVAGAAAGLAAWTKDEGLLMLPLIPLAAMLRGPRIRAVGYVAAGAALPILTLVVFKRGVQTSSYLVAAQSGSAIWDKLLDSSRWASVASQIVGRVESWGEAPGGALVWVAVAVAIALRPDRRSAVRGALGLLLVMAMLAGYSLVYVITPLALDWQIAVSFDRVFVQVWPAFVWAAFQLAGSRTESSSSSSPNP
jgi:hypothetical protein